MAGAHINNKRPDGLHIINIKPKGPYENQNYEGLTHDTLFECFRLTISKNVNKVQQLSVHQRVREIKEELMKEGSRYI